MPPKPDLVLPNIDYYANKSVDKSSDVKTCDAKPKTVRRECSAPIIEDWESDSDEEDEPKPKVVKKIVESKTVEKDDVSKNVKPSYAKIEFVRSKSARHVKQDTNSQSIKARGNQRNWNNMKPIWNNDMRVNHQNRARMTHPHPKRNFVPTAVLTRSGQVSVNTAKQNLSKATVSVNTARPINTAFPRPNVNLAKPRPNTFKKAHSSIGRPFKKITTKKNSNFYKRVNTVKGSGVNTARTTVNTARPRATVNVARPKITVNTTRPKAVLKAVRGNMGNVVKASAYWIWRPKQKVLDHGNPKQELQKKCIFDSGYSRHMTGNKAYLTDFEEIDGGFVAFGGNSRGGKITRKGKIRTGKLDFEDVYFVKELKFKLLSMSQICDKKNSVLFTDTECVVLSSNFKLPDENQVLLKVPRKHNMYSVDLKNIVPSGGLTCLFARATLDESNQWHRRLRHINFKTMNKLVKANLVRGLPSKIFENNHSCVACQKGKKHIASCKTKTVSSICQPLQMLHMDLFGPTFVKSLMKKTYFLVVTDDFSRFSWVFFLATKDETSGILKAFITGIENLIDLRVKLIRCDNGTEFKNKVMNEFCEMKAVNTACYVQNRVLVIKPHNKTPYELFMGRKPALGFMRPFGCPVAILNTIDHLGKFDRKADEGLFVGYSTNSKAFRVFNSRTRIVEENMHVQFNENTPNIAGSGPNWLLDIDALTKTINYQPVSAGNQSNGSAGIKDSNDTGQAGKKTVPDQEYLLLPLWTSNLKSLDDKVADDAEKKDCDDQEKEDDVNSTNTVNAASTNEVNAAGTKTSIELPNDPDMPPLEEIVYSEDDEEVGAEADMTNLETNIPVSPIPTTRIHKDHPLDQVIGDVQSAT
ncbi:putative ribonuclease H-like domain-containing protein [Tanacetum coccineum]